MKSMVSRRQKPGPKPSGRGIMIYLPPKVLRLIKNEEYEKVGLEIHRILRKKESDYLPLKDGSQAKFDGYSDEGSEVWLLASGEKVNIWDLKSRGLV